MSYNPTIGLEIHAELKTASKMFCSCKNNPDEESPNVNVCPICMGHPGTLPVLNMTAIEHVLKIGIAIDAKLADFTEWDRKHYFYPDIPKGYQLSQYAYPLVRDGQLAGVDVERIHLEEDTASSTHDQHDNSLINFNRSGVPLLELVTKPVIHDAKTAVTFAKELQLLLRYLKAGDANMEKGEMRVEANISVASEEDTKNNKLGTKTEVKNLNSFRSVEKAIAFEVERQISILHKGDKVIQETRGWDDVNNETYSQRVKESSHDYRYFPDPDIPKLKLSEIPSLSPSLLAHGMPELPSVKRHRYMEDFGMTEKEVAVFVDMPLISKYFESAISAYKDDKKKVKLTVNYILSDYLGLIKKDKKDIEDNITTIDPKSIAELIALIDSNLVSSRGAKEILMIMYGDAKSGSPKDIAEKHSLIQKSSADDILPAIEKIITDNPSVVAEYKSGKIASLQFLIGQAMKATKGSANPAVVKELLISKLGQYPVK